ncbi:GldG family protein [Marispirochaeta aestuarii]|uniref:GldG family protein n=1 Tax=Marispirochaeta aestuarii TaxID=1963862 RepID=UPI0029C6BCE8|nr:GldG family protein [Marispirochaeta aestuarii]
MMQSLRSILKNKRLRYGAYAATLTASLLCGLVILNMIVQQIPLKIDLTKNRLFSLSEQTKNILTELEEPVTLYALYPAGEEETSILEILQEYDRIGPSVDLKIIDPDLNPGFLARFAGEGEKVESGSIIVEGVTRFRVIPYMELYDIRYNPQGHPQVTGIQVEPRVSQAINYVSSGYNPKIYELSGHGEYSLGEYGIESMLRAESYEIESLNLLRSEEVPADASVLLVSSPKYEISDEELRKIYEYVENGGRMIVMVDFIGDPSPGGGAILQSYGLEIGEGFIMEADASRYVRSPLFVAPELMDHGITEPLVDNNLDVITPNAVSLVQTGRKPRSVDLTPLLSTTARAWSRTDRENSSLLLQETDMPGPHIIAWTVERKKYTDGDPPAFRVVAVGNSIFLGSIPPYGQIKGNIDFFLSALSWLSEGKERVSIRAKSFYRSPLRLTAFQLYLYAGILIILIPAALLVCGTIVWIRRRHL